MRTLELGWRTPKEWARRVLEEPLALLADHAWCELGAASAAQGLIARFSDVEPLVARLLPLALEELRHFRRVERLLRTRGGALGPARRNPYAERLLERVERGHGLIDRLLVAALIETRSLERFTLLVEEVEDPELEALFAELGLAEAAHASLFLDLASVLFGEELVEERRERWVALEARLIPGLPRAPRIHSGWFEVLPGALPARKDREFELRPTRS